MRLPGLQKPDYRNTLNVADAVNSDIISTIDKNFQTAVEQTKNVARQFEGESAQATAFNIWKFLRQHITYKKDDDSGQLVRLPSRFIADGTGDCKSYSLTAAAILANLGLPVAFRYASYNASPIPTHVYVVTKDESGRTIIVDGVYHDFNSEKIPVHKYDKQMKVYTLSGLSEAFDFQETMQGIGKKGKGKLARRIKKFALAPMRQSFLALVLVNMFGLARKLARVIKRNPSAVKNKWEQLGGKFSKLQSITSKGLKFVPKKKREGLKGIGVAPIAALLASAATIIAALGPILKKHGEEKLPGEGPDLSTGEQKETILEKVMDVTQGAAERMGKSEEAVDPTQPENADKFDKQVNVDDTPGGMNIKPVYLIGAAAAIYFLMKKK